MLFRSTIICPRSNIEIISEGFPDFVRVNNSKCLDSFRTGPGQIAMIRSTSFTLFRKPKDLIVWICKIQALEILAGKGEKRLAAKVRNRPAL